MPGGAFSRVGGIVTLRPAGLMTEKGSHRARASAGRRGGRAGKGVGQWLLCFQVRVAAKGSHDQGKAMQQGAFMLRHRQYRLKAAEL